MSDLRINIRFLFWHLQVKEATWKISIVFNNHFWLNKTHALKDPFTVYEWNLK